MVKEKGINFLILAVGIIMFMIGFLIDNESFRRLSFVGSIVLFLVLVFRILVDTFIDLDPTYKKNKDIDLNDERNRLIKEKSASKTALAMNLILIISSIICSFVEIESNLNPIISDTLFAVFALQAILFIGLNNYYKRKI
jgi:hypothetical protein